MASKGVLGKPAMALIIVAVLVAGIAIGYYYAVLTTPKPTGIRIGYLILDIHQSPFFIANDQGWYEEEIWPAPVKKEYTSGIYEMGDFMAGELDAGYVGVAPAMIYASQGAEIVILASSNKEGSAIVAKPEINSVEELNGKKVGTPGIGTVQDILLGMVEEEFDITVTHAPYGVTELPLALERGDIDAFIAWEIFCADAVVRGIGNIVYTSHDILPDHQCCVLWVSKKLYDERPDIVKDLVRVHVRALKFIQENSSDAQQLIASITGRDIAVVQNAWQRMTWSYHVNTDSMITFASAMIAKEKIKPEDVPDVNAFVTGLVNENILNTVLGEMGISS
ncbi:MAG: ABC transporter substrate-binding protein [archaeon]|nr:ABC transporter substrate-binding protein [archaeon]MCP8315101.1 ABC transporter substrate-binding protein [archaeon]MCP8319388.1 ABC transporter substrate-binding protein [archaeon]